MNSSPGGAATLGQIAESSGLFGFAVKYRGFGGETRSTEGRGGVWWEGPGSTQGDNQNSFEQSHPRP